MFVLRDLIAQLTSLLRKEAQLARVELSENVSRAAIGSA
jgi:Putative Actinobacterial Holin-X, holin superfamily III